MSVVPHFLLLIDFSVPLLLPSVVAASCKLHQGCEGALLAPENLRLGATLAAT